MKELTIPMQYNRGISCKSSNSKSTFHSAIELCMQLLFTVKYNRTIFFQLKSVCSVKFALDDFSKLLCIVDMINGHRASGNSVFSV